MFDQAQVFSSPALFRMEIYATRKEYTQPTHQARQIITDERRTSHLLKKKQEIVVSIIVTRIDALLLTCTGPID